ncbi:MAG: cytochrome ubiquinol oxidase subunit I [Opitutales bacterium]|nr:cytochrome ubiquinol oxidase subunit I [Opitutales bacterium]
MDPEMLARIQFALTAGFHFLFPPLSIGLGVFLAVVHGIAYKKKEAGWQGLAEFWTKLFALIFAFGVATGIVLEFEFGTNWARYSRFVGDVFGSPLAIEAIFAFFMESCFLGIVLFGRGKVSAGFRYFSVVMMAIGAHLSAIWILVANSWMQTPAGYHLVETARGPRAEITSFWEMVFNPSTLDRIWHVTTAAWTTGAFLVIAVCAWQLLKKRCVPEAQKGLKAGLAFAAVAMALLFASGHSSAVLLEKTQPVKFAATEGIFETGEAASFHLFGIVDEAAGTVHGPEVPGAVNIMLGRGLCADPENPILGLNDVPAENRPPVQLTFQSFHMMVYCGGAMALLLALGFWLWWRGRLFESRWWLSFAVPAALLPQIANQFGWIATEVGRQPWIVQGLLRTEDAFSTNVSGGQLIFSLIFFTLVYTTMALLFLFVFIKKIRDHR